MKLLINTDGGARGNPGPAGIGVVFYNEGQKIIAEFKQYIGEATNNVAEYRALVLALTKASNITPKPENLEIRMDSELIVRQMNGQYKIKEPTLQILASEVLKLKNNFQSVVFRHVPRAQNSAADKLVNEAIDQTL